MKKQFFLFSIASSFFAPVLLYSMVSPIPILQPTANQVTVSTVSQLVNAVAAAPKGRTIMLADGTYDLTNYWPLRLRTDSIGLYGASQDPTKVILRGAGFTSSNNNEELIKVEAVGINLAYFTLRDGRANGLKIQTGGNHNLLVHNVNFIDICERSIKAPDIAVSKNGIVRYCLFEQVTPITNAIPNLNGYPPGDYIAGMDMMKIEGWRIHDNVFKNIRGMNGGGRAAVFLWNGCKKVTVDRNIFMGCDRSVALGNPGDANTSMDSGIVKNNYIVAGVDASIEMCYAINSQITSNSVYSANPGYNRTVHLFNNGAGNSLNNNIIMGNQLLTGTAPASSGNYFTTTANPVSLWFKNPSTGDLTLTLGASQPALPCGP
jgi:hypothetical protein